MTTSPEEQASQDKRSKVRELFAPLYADLLAEDGFHVRKPLLAHYTSLSTLELMLKNNEIWLSNPLFMTDIEEVRFGINAGFTLFLDSKEIKEACGTNNNLEVVNEAFKALHLKFANEHIIETYILCLSEHDTDDYDGVLSMWRGYGRNGDGAAIVFDAGNMPVRPNSPLVVAKVFYGTPEKRKAWLKEKIAHFARIIKEAHLEREHLGLAAYMFYERLKLFSVFSKHVGFKEEREWRLAYFRDRDTSDFLASSFGYSIGPNGVAPKLKLKVENLPGATGSLVSFSTILDRIILGPSISSPLARASIEKMLNLLGKGDLVNRLKASTIPFRSLPTI